MNNIEYSGNNYKLKQLFELAVSVSHHFGKNELDFLAFYKDKAINNLPRTLIEVQALNIISSLFKEINPDNLWVNPPGNSQKLKDNRGVVKEFPPEISYVQDFLSVKLKPVSKLGSSISLEEITTNIEVIIELLKGVNKQNSYEVSNVLFMYTSTKNNASGVDEIIARLQALIFKINSMTLNLTVEFTMVNPLYSIPKFDFCNNYFEENRKNNKMHILNEMSNFQQLRSKFIQKYLANCLDINLFQTNEWCLLIAAFTCFLGVLGKSRKLNTPSMLKINSIFLKQYNQGFQEINDELRIIQQILVSNNLLQQDVFRDKISACLKLGELKYCSAEELYKLFENTIEHLLVEFDKIFLQILEENPIYCLFSMGILATYFTKNSQQIGICLHPDLVMCELSKNIMGIYP